jgi:general secretion pathway protein L
LLQQAAEAPPGVTELALAVAVAPRVRTLDLLPPALRPRRLTRAQAASAALLAATVVLAIAALLVPGYRESRRLAAINARIARLEGEVRSVEQVLHELERKRRLLATVETVQKTTVRPLPVLREMTELLPGDAWLTTLSLDVKGVELTGQAASAAALIPLLENSPHFERVEFASPVTRGRDREQFRIRAAWEGGLAAASARAAGAVAPPQAAAPAAAPAPAAAAPGRIPQLPAAPAAPGPASAGPRSGPR